MKTCNEIKQHVKNKRRHNLRRNKDLVSLKQDKGKGVVLLDRTVYTDKCLSILNTQQFQQLDISPTAANEN